MFGFLFAGTKVKDLEKRIAVLENQNEVLKIALQSIQENLITTSASARSLERDVKDVRLAINEFVRQAEQAHAAYLLSTIPDDGYEH
jgi:chaperonin cofactor prefoldin